VGVRCYPMQKDPVVKKCWSQTLLYLNVSIVGTVGMFNCFDGFQDDAGTIFAKPQHTNFCKYRLNPIYYIWDVCSHLNLLHSTALF
jgi:hypothetical protein